MTLMDFPARSFGVSTGPGVHIRGFELGPADGAPVVILHGLAGSAGEFVQTALALPEFRTVLIDLRGHGRSTTRPGDLSREAFVADVVRVIESVVSAPLTLIGQSLGTRRCWWQPGALTWSPGWSFLRPAHAAEAWTSMNSWVNTSGPGLCPSEAAQQHRSFLGTDPWPGRGWLTWRTGRTGCGRGLRLTSWWPRSKDWPRPAGTSGRASLYQRSLCMENTGCSLRRTSPSSASAAAGSSAWIWPGRPMTAIWMRSTPGWRLSVSSWGSEADRVAASAVWGFAARGRAFRLS
ncbi:alpha/beta fold hydrolase [Pseudarthrobacter scleromae]|uniref:alpha/beta fold hydrolase n=1 Tax=Pseudarthrobacter scleromae TaxID=158897 RepID=UPI00363E50CC